MIYRNSLTSIWIDATRQVLKDGADAFPRGHRTKELVGEQLRIVDPRQRIPVLPVRKWSLAYAGAELAWYLGKMDDLKFIEYYAPSYEQFSDDGVKLHGAYGPRIFGTLQGQSVGPAQWERAKRSLESDPDSRQAVVAIYSASDLGYQTKDTPCTLSLQFLRRNRELHLITTMRSNDLWLGTLYDIFCFTVLQEMMARELNVDVGEYFHNVGSLHLYDKNWTAATRVITKLEDEYVVRIGIPPGTKEELVEDLLSRERTARYAEMDVVRAILETYSQKGTVNLWDMIETAWLWKRVQGSAEIPEDWRRVMSEMLHQKLSLVFDRCFF